MTDISQYALLPTVQAIYDRYEQRRQNHRPHLGASQIGAKCDRYLWYQWRWCESPQFDGRMLRLFDHGNAEEDRLIRDLRATGLTVYDKDPDTGRQFTFTALGGHFGASLDGVVHGLSESGKWHLFEAKTASNKRFTALKKNGLEKESPQYAAQVQVGMELADLERTLHLTVNKDNDEIYGERLRHDPKQAQALLNRAERIIFSEEPLERISDRPDWYECKFCPMHAICHGNRVAEVNCRTCIHSTAERDGTWTCARHGKTLTAKEQRAGCDRHLMRPSLIHAEATDAGEDWIEYDNGAWYNACEGVAAGRHCYTSAEMRAAEQLPLDDGAEDIRVAFDGSVGE